jgi:3-methyladenine DNA glycosylase AlkD
MTAEQIVSDIKNLANAKSIEVWAKAGIITDNCYGVGLTKLKLIARDIRKQHELALELWDSGIHEARLLSTMIEDGKMISSEQIDKQILDINSWDLADKYCENVISRTPFMFEKIEKWLEHPNQLIKRSAFMLISIHAKKHKKLDDKYFEDILVLIEQKLQFEKNLVRDGMNQALIAIGSRNKHLNYMAIQIVKNIGHLKINSEDPNASSRDVIKFLTSEKVQKSISGGG